MSNQPKTYSLTLSEFRNYLATKTSEMRACYQEMEEIQFQFNDIFKKELEAWQEEFKYCFPRVLAERHNMPAPLAASIDQAEKEELAKLQQEADSLQQSIAQDKQRCDELLRLAQSIVRRLHRSNPELNAQEEDLKAGLTALEDEYAQAFEQIEALEKGFGAVLNSGKIAKLRKRQRSIKDEQAKLSSQLREIRKNWQALLEQTAQTQGDLRQEWGQKSIAIQQSQSRLDHITANLNDLAQQQAITRVLSGLDASPGVEGELGQALDRLVERNKTRKAYEEGLKAVAEALGLTKGVAEGMERFTKSVEGVLEEQRRFNLAEVSVVLPQWVINVAETWQPLRERVKDEKHMGTHPLEFSQIIKSFITDRLPDEIIQRYFETLGDALNAATRAWS